jgi:hypothetical protein
MDQIELISLDFADRNGGKRRYYRQQGTPLPSRAL